VPFRETGMPAVQEIEDKTHDYNRFNHGPGDTVDHMDHDYFLAMVKLAIAAVAHWGEPVSGEVPPTATASPVPSVTLTPSVTPLPTGSPTPTRIPNVTPAPEGDLVFLPLGGTGRN